MDFATCNGISSRSDWEDRDVDTDDLSYEDPQGDISYDDGDDDC